MSADDETWEFFRRTLSPRLRQFVELVRCQVVWVGLIRPERQGSGGASWLDTWLNQMWMDWMVTQGSFGWFLDSIASDPEVNPFVNVYDLGGVDILKLEWIVDSDSSGPGLTDAIPIAQSEIPRLRDSFAGRQKVAVWRDMRAATRTDYQKHYSSATLDRQTIVASTSRPGSASLLFPETEAHLSKMLWMALDDIADRSQFELLRNVPQGVTRIYLDLAAPVGATHGKMTSLLCFQIDGSTGLAHCYPISESEAHVALGLSSPLHLHYEDATVPICYFDEFQEALTIG
jgi:hypothetical protein